MAHQVKSLVVAAAFTCLYGPFCVLAADSEDRIRETARITGDSVEVVRSYQAKCDSGVTVNMNACVTYFLNAADKELNNLYQQLRQQVRQERGEDSTAERSLIAAQRAWIAFRDATCDYENDGARGARWEGLFHASCLTEKTRKRNKELKEYLTCTNGDCP